MLRSLRFLPLTLLLVIVAGACGGSATSSSTNTTTVVGGLASDAAKTASPTIATATAPAAQTPQPGAPAKLGTYSGAAVTQKAPNFDALPGAKASFGTLGQAVYQIEVPDNWNGDLVMYAHGFAGFGTEVSVDPPPRALRQQLIDEGYAWAASSFSENGYTPGIGADDTLALKNYFVQQHGAPKHTYIAGASMGGNVVTLSLENFPQQYDGALAMCGALTGEEEIDYLISWGMLAEYTSGVTLPIGQGAAKMSQALLVDLPKALGSPDAPTQAGKQFASAIDYLTGGPRPFFAEGFKQQILINLGLLLLDPNRESVVGRAATNVGVTYHVDPALGLTDQQLNDGIQRLAADPDARNATKHPDAVPTTGKITKPLLTIHGTGDLFVPISIETAYRQRVDAAGAGNLLVQRAIRSAGHCQFSDAEYSQAFNDLVSWVKDGKKPAGDNISGDLSDIGKQFTNPIRPGDPGTKS
jgi:pimeloyl-ACP methyl ester carboxylesterase